MTLSICADSERRERLNPGLRISVLYFSFQILCDFDFYRSSCKETLTGYFFANLIDFALSESIMKILFYNTCY